MWGFLAGLLSGSVVGLGGVVVMSLLLPLAVPPEAVVDAPDATSTPDAVGADSGVNADGRDARLVKLVPTAPEGKAGMRDTLVSLADGATDPGPPPEVGGAAGALTKSAEKTAPDPVSAGADAPVSISLGFPGAAPQVPPTETESSIPALPTQPAAPSVPSISHAFDAPQFKDSTPTSNTSIDTAVNTITATSPQGPSLAPGTELVVAGHPVPAGAVTGEDAPSVSRPADDAPQTVHAAAVQTLDTVTVPRPAAAPAPVDGNRLAPRSAVVPFTKRNASGPTPIVAFAESFENSNDKPLIDNEKSPGTGALGDFPCPLTFAIDPLDPAAREKMRAHRDAGFEILVLAAPCH
ncbi:MAG: hypothetical protein GDA36_01440 [Rhodobacteraceae bacterium]|nr:hypothetical protein [Paracoccaceae bacterium]